MSSQSDVERTDRAMESAELAADRAGELAELVGMYRAKTPRCSSPWMTDTAVTPLDGTR